MSTANKTFKRGELLYKEGDKVQSIYLIQAGSVSLHLSRQKQNIELATLSSSQIVGEHGLSGSTTHPHSATAMSETKVVELPLEAVKTQLEASPQLIKFLAKGLYDKLKVILKELQSARLERDNTPCPPEQTAKIFAALFHAAKTKGEKQANGTIKVSWLAMRQYAQRVFLESPKRLEMSTNIFVKLGWAKYEMGKPDDNPEGAEEIQSVTFTDLGAVEEFFEYYQYYYFKGGKQDLLRTDERVMGMLNALLELSIEEKPDRNNIVRCDYGKVIEKFKTSLGFQLNNDHWTAFETKGVFVKRQAGDAGVSLHFDRKEFESTAKIWKVLREVERWNEKGSVDSHEPLEAKKVAKHASQCPTCGKGFEAVPKFCSECGHKFSAAA